MISDNLIIIIWVVEGSVYKIGYLCWDGKMVALKYLYTETVAHQAHATDYDLSFGGAIFGISIPLPTKQKISTLNSSIKIQNSLTLSLSLFTALSNRKYKNIAFDFSGITIIPHPTIY